MRSLLFAPLLAAALAPLSTLAAEPQEAFWSRLHSLCGQAFAGRVVDPQPQDAAFAGEALVMQVRDCGEREIRIPFQVGANRSRTWVLTRTPEGLRLKHEHRHPDGSEDRVTQYGGDTRGAGSATAQAFHADAHTAELIPAAASNVWSVEVDGAHFVYRLQRPGTPPRRFEARFDLRQPQPLPPPAWGAALR
jgi:hypothetical protein